MKRSVVVVGVLVLALGGLLVWRCASRGGGSGGDTGSAAGGATTTAAAPDPRARGRIDPDRVARGSLAGTITDEKRAPIAKARVCAAGSSSELEPELLRDPRCATADDGGRYKIDNLLPARYEIFAGAKPFRPAAYRAPNERRTTPVRLAAGEHKTGLDIALRSGGVEITGTVADLTGGPVAGAKVSASSFDDRGAAYGDTDEQGKFSLWVAPGSVGISATAEGYTDGFEWGQAPGTFELMLTPESSLAGTVVDAATQQPVAGAHVTVGVGTDWSWDGNDETVITDERGQFRATRLTPGRKVTSARTERGYGRADGSVLVGLGQHVDGVVVKLFPAARVAGTIVVAPGKTPCDEGGVHLSDPDQSDREVSLRRHDDGTHAADGVLPGTYKVTVSCAGYQARAKYDPIVVADKDVTGVVWEVEPGSTVRGRVLTKSGEPVESAVVNARSTSTAARERVAHARDNSDADGTYELAALAPGSYQLEVETDRGVAPKDGYKVDVAAGATATKDLVLEESGAIRGTVVDDAGKPVAGVRVTAQMAAGMSFRTFDEQKSDGAGAFAIDGLRPGDYRVIALGDGFFDELRKPGTTDDAKQGERASVRAGQTATVKLVVEARSGTIRGSVVDAAGKAVTDAYVSVARESDAAGARPSSVSQTRWSWDQKPVLTSVDGTFTVGKLTPGKYTVRAYRKGGGEAVAEHVATGATTRLQIKPTGSIEGTAKRGSAQLAEFSVTLNDTATGFHRTERFYMTGGRFTVRDLPQGSYKLAVEAQGARKQVDVPLAEGEAKTGITVELESLVTITGRVVEHGTTKPVAGIRLFARPVGGGGSVRMGFDDDGENISDDAGRFTLKNVPAGMVSLFGASKDFRASAHGFLNEVRTIDPKSPDIGDVPIFKRRVKPGEPEGDLGVNFAEQPPDTPPDKRERKVSYIDPTGPAAKTDLKVGDVIVSVDGIDVTGLNAGKAWSLMSGPPGAKLTLGLARGATVVITLAPP